MMITKKNGERNYFNSEAEFLNEVLNQDDLTKRNHLPSTSIYFEVANDKSELCATKADLTDEEAASLMESRLIANINGERFPINVCAIPSLDGRMEIKGPGLGKISSELFCSLLNERFSNMNCEVLTVIEDNVLVAILSDKYEILSVRNAIGSTVSYLEKTTGHRPVFKGGYVSHEETSASYDFTEAFNSPNVNGVFNAGFRITTSNVGLSSTTITPYIEKDGNVGNRIQILMPEFSMIHRGKSNTLDSLVKGFNSTFANFQDFENRLNELAQMPPLKQPGSVFMRASKKMFTKSGNKKTIERMRKMFAYSYAEVSSYNGNNIEYALTNTGEYIFPMVTPYDVATFLLDAPAYVVDDTSGKTPRQSALDRAGLAAGQVIFFNYEDLDKKTPIRFTEAVEE